MNNRNFLFLSLFSYLVTISCSAMETRESIVPLNRDDFKKFTTSALEITEELHGLLKNKKTENIENLTKNIEGLTKKLIATTENIQKALTGASIDKQDPTRAAKLIISPEQKITKPVLRDYEEAILEIRFILLPPNSNELTKNTDTSIDTLKTYKNFAQNDVDNNSNLGETLRNDSELWIKDIQKLITLKEKALSKTKKNQSKDNIVETSELTDQPLAPTETPEAKTQRIVREIINETEVTKLSNEKKNNYLENIIYLANNIEKINTASFSQLQGTLFLSKLCTSLAPVISPTNESVIPLEKRTQLLTAYQTINQHFAHQTQQTAKIESETKEIETPEAKTQRITQEIIQAKDVILLSQTERNYYLKNIIILAKVIATLDNNLILDLQGSELFLQKYHDYLALKALLCGVISLNEQKQFTEAWNTIKNHKQQEQKPQINNNNNNNPNQKKITQSSSGKTTYNIPNIVTGLTGLTLIVILAILYKYDKLSIIMEKISNLVSSRVSSGA